MPWAIAWSITLLVVSRALLTPSKSAAPATAVIDVETTASTSVNADRCRVRDFMPLLRARKKEKRARQGPLEHRAIPAAPPNAPRASPQSARCIETIGRRRGVSNLPEMRPGETEF